MTYAATFLAEPLKKQADARKKSIGLSTCSALKT